MKLGIVAVFVAFITFTLGNVATGAGHASSQFPTRRVEGRRRMLSSLSSRPRRRDLSAPTAVPTKAARKGDDPPAPSEAPPIDHNPFEIVEPFPFLTDSKLSPSNTDTTSTADSTASSMGQGPDPPSTSDNFEIWDPIMTQSVPEFSGTPTWTKAMATQTGTLSSGLSKLPDPASDTVWEDAANKGCRLVDAMRVSDHDAGQLYDPPRNTVQSELSSYEDFSGWGWNGEEVTSGNLTDFDGGRKYPEPGWGIGHVLRDLKLSDKAKDQGGKNTIIKAVHGQKPFDSQTYKAKDGKTYPVTGGEFKIGVNTEEGVLMALDRHSPVSAAKERNPQVSDDQLPAVRTFSDVGYLNYKKMLGKDPSSLKYMMSLMITNEETGSIISRALKSKSKGLGPWPGEAFSWRSREFKALLGTPNGIGFGYLLVQHKSQLGDMFITKVQVFAGDTWHQFPNMVFTVEPRPPQKPSGAKPQIVEPTVTAAPAKARRGKAGIAQMELYVQGEKNMRRERIVHAEL